MIVYIKQTAEGGFSALQRQHVPAVYLDQCAMRTIAEQSELTSRFVAAMCRASASLLLSSMTIYEFSILSDMRHAQAVDSLLRQLFRHLYFIHCEPFRVIAAEDAITDNVPDIAPHADLDMFKQTVILALQQKGPLELTTIFSARSIELRPVIDQFCTNVRNAFEMLKDRIDVDPVLRRNANRALENVGDRKMATRALLTALIKPLHDDQLPSENDTIDLLHTVVPAAYAEFVVLDGRWASALKQATDRIRRLGYKAPIARAFSLRNDGIDEFLTALEVWPTKNPK